MQKEIVPTWVEPNECVVRRHADNRGHTAGTGVDVKLAQRFDDFSVPTEAFASGFVLRRCEAVRPMDRIESNAPRKAEEDQQAIVAYGEDLALVLVRYTYTDRKGSDRYFLSGAGRMVHPQGYQISDFKSLRIPRPIMLELLSRPYDPRQLFVLAAGIVPIFGARTPPRIIMSWACGHTAENAINRWRASPRGLLSLEDRGERAALITTLLIPRTQMDWVLRYQPIRE